MRKLAIRFTYIDDKRFSNIADCFPISRNWPVNGSSAWLDQKNQEEPRGIQIRTQFLSLSTAYHLCAYVFLVHFIGGGGYSRDMEFSGSNISSPFRRWDVHDKEVVRVYLQDWYFHGNRSCCRWILQSRGFVPRILSAKRSLFIISEFQRRTTTTRTVVARNVPRRECLQKIIYNTVHLSWYVDKKL